MILFNIFLTKKTIRPGRCPGANRFFGGETGIRTRDTTFAVYSLSRRAPSTYSAISPEYFNRLASGPYFYLDVKSFDQIRRTRCVYGGGSRIRTHVPLPGNGFQDRRFRPLSHPSGRIYIFSIGRSVRSIIFVLFPPEKPGRQLRSATRSKLRTPARGSLRLLTYSLVRGKKNFKVVARFIEIAGKETVADETKIRNSPGRR